VNELTILIPVLGRPHRVKPVLESATAATPCADVLFIADPDDTDELEVLTCEGADFIAPGGTYAEKINQAVREVTSPLVFTGADDLTFIPGWFEKAKAHMSDEIRVVGITDQVTERNRLGHHAPHFLMCRDYALIPTISGGRGPFCEEYRHCWVDNEFIATAEQRGVIHIATDSQVHHHHFFDGSAEMDATYEKGQSFYRLDRRTFRRRRKLWM
jgi:hypothetical protein